MKKTTRFDFFLCCLLMLLFSCLCMKVCLAATFKNCNIKEREALVAFKNSLFDPSERLSSWVGGDCCNWKGIGCDNQTGVVTKIDLRNPLRSRDGVYDPGTEQRYCLGGKVNASLLKLNYLNYLDLSLNDFGGIPFPGFISMLRNLSYLNLASSLFAGEIPSKLGNLSNLQHLDLYESGLGAKSLHWVSSLFSLRYLNLGKVLLYSVSKDWLHSINQLPSLVELHLYNSDIENTDLYLPFVNFTSLVTLNMSSNFFNTPFPLWLSNLTSLETLDLSLNGLTGPIPTASLCNLKNLVLSTNDLNVSLRDVFGLFTGCSRNRLEFMDLRDLGLVGEIPEDLRLLSNLQFLDLSDNSLWGSIPSSIGNLAALRKLDLSVNEMNETIPESIGKLSELVELQLQSNKWKGTITEAHLMNLTSLVKLIVTSDPPMSLVFNVAHDWVPPFELTYLYIENCLAGPMFGSWLQSQSLLTYLVLKNTGISDIIPTEWFSKIASRITFLDMSNNQIKGELPPRMVSPNLTSIDLRSNLFRGGIPLWSTSAMQLSLQDNLFDGPLPVNIGELMPNLTEIDLSENNLNESIPSSICEMKSLSLLSLRSNGFSGQLPDCWDKLPELLFLDVSNNSISGQIPKSIWNSRLLHGLLLSNNDFVGEIPKVSQNCTALMILDLVGNKFSGSLPIWIGNSLSSLLILLVGSNFFVNDIPQELCHLSYLHFLDLSHNNLSGTIPRCFGDLSALVNGSYDIFHDVQRQYGIYYDGHVMVRTKGRELTYSETLVFVNGVDLSGNNLSGIIPKEITNLSLLGILNLSRNHLSGSMPKDIGKLRWLETLDLSLNNLSGSIPQSLSSLTSLTALNLSYNNLAGRIPTGSQLQTLHDSSIYQGNPLLCGAPLLTNCPGDKVAAVPPTPKTDGAQEEEDASMFGDLWFYVSVVGGFIFGFWGVCGSLLIKKSRRDAYFKFLDNTKDKISHMIS